MGKARAADWLKRVGFRVVGDPGVRVSGVAYRSDRVTPGDVFFCIKGLAADGHDFAQDAVSRGAVALVVERELPLEVTQFVVPDSRVALAIAAAARWGDPGSEVAVFGITGTNGKTTTTYLLDSILREAGMRTGVIGTVETRIGDERIPASRTTPESADLQELLASMRDAGVQACCMEVSSHAIDLHRVDGIDFAAVGFTNLTQDHLDYHRTIDEYFAVKKRLFTHHAARARVIDMDTDHGRLLAIEVGDALTVGRHDKADVRAVDETASATGTEFTLVTGDESARVRLPLAGAYNVSNALMAAGCALAVGIPFDTVCGGLARAPQVPGRLERVSGDVPFTVVVDYAHTPDSLEKAIEAVRGFAEGRVITVFGCGGDRDPAKRPLMGRAAAALSDIVIVTSDNPRSEEPLAIIADIERGMLAGTAECFIEPDRRTAIRRAIRIARPGDVVLIAGKGHEDYQIFADRTVHFDDREEAMEAMSAC